MAPNSAWLAALLPALVSAADVPIYNQCGGAGYTGSSVCVEGAVCSAYNQYYAQCVPGVSSAAGSTSAPASTALTTPHPPSTTGSAPSSTATGLQYLITFGDSYSQTGFDIKGTKPAPGNPLGNPALPGWTASGGLNWVGFLVSQFNVSNLLSYNFAYGGATTDSNIVKPFAPTVLSFVDQVSNFSTSLASHPSYAPWTAENTLVGVWLGVNDVGNTYWLNNVTDVVSEIVTRYTEQLQIIYNAGARNFFLLSVPPINESPMMLAYSKQVQDQEAGVIAQYNEKLGAALKNFTTVNSGVTAKLINTSIPFQTAIDDPTAYGAPNATCYASDGKSCLWFNNLHPGIAINKLVAGEIAKAWKGSFF